MAQTQIIISDIQGNCDGCYRKKINTITNFLNESSLKSAVTFSFNKASQKIYINTDASSTNKILRLLEKNGYTALSKQSLIADIPYDELKKKLDYKIKRKPTGQHWYQYLKPIIALLIGYTELCCVLMAWLPMSAWFVIAGVNLALITWLGWDYFKVAKSALLYLLPPLVLLLAVIVMPIVFPVTAGILGFICPTLAAGIMVAIIGIVWFKRNILTMETLITLSIAMAWLFSTIQLCIPALSLAFGAQLYFQDSMIILGVIGIAQQIKKSWTSTNDQWLVLVNNDYFEYQSTDAITEGHIILLQPNTAYPFPLQLLNDEIEVNQTIAKDEINTKTKIKTGEWIQPWVYTQDVDPAKPLFAKVGPFRKTLSAKPPSWADRVAQYFLPLMLTVACMAASAWYIFAPAALATIYAIKAFMGVLMAACPCVLGVVAPICEALGKMKLRRCASMNLKESLSVEHVTSINKVVFDKTGTLTTIQNNDDDWPMRPDCNVQLVERLVKQGKQVFILSGDDNTDRYRRIMTDMGLNHTQVLCHPVFSADNAKNKTLPTDYYKTILLTWLAHPDRKAFPDSIINLVKAFHQVKNQPQEKEDNIQTMINVLEGLRRDIKPVDQTYLLYVDDGPGLVSEKPGCLMLQCKDQLFKSLPCPHADGQIDSPASLPLLFEYMKHTKAYLNQQLNLAWLYNIIAIPVMAGALFFLFMPSPWVGAVLMNVFSMYLIYRSKQLPSYLDRMVVPSFSPNKSPAVEANNLQSDQSEKPLSPASSILNESNLSYGL